MIWQPSIIPSSSSRKYPAGTESRSARPGMAECYAPGGASTTGDMAPPAALSADGSGDVCRPEAGRRRVEHVRARGVEVGRASGPDGPPGERARLAGRRSNVDRADDRVAIDAAPEGVVCQPRTLDRDSKLEGEFGAAKLDRLEDFAPPADACDTLHFLELLLEQHVVLMPPPVELELPPPAAGDAGRDDVEKDLRVAPVVDGIGLPAAQVPRAGEHARARPRALQDDRSQ